MTKRPTLRLAAAAFAAAVAATATATTTTALARSPSSYVGDPSRRRRRRRDRRRSVRSAEPSPTAFLPPFPSSSSSLPVRFVRRGGGAAAAARRRRPPPLARTTFVVPTASSSAVLAAAAAADDDENDRTTPSRPAPPPPPTPTGAAAGPKVESARRGTSSAARRRRPPSPRRRSSSSARARRSSSPPSPPPRRRAPHRHDHTQADARPFANAKTEVSTQVGNEDAPAFDAPPLNGNDDGDVVVVERPHFETKSLDELFPEITKGFSEAFCDDGAFRDKLRDAMRRDVFDTTEAYSSMSEKARTMLLMPDSSLQGSWKCDGGNWIRRRPDGEGGNEGGPDDTSSLRMVRLAKVLRDRFGPTSPTGDEFMDRIGSLCGPNPSTHWIDIVGVSDRRIAHSWHQDTGRSSNEGEGRTVLLGFPAEDGYEGPGVFSHLVKLKRERRAPDGHPPNEPVLYQGTIDDKYVVRPKFAMGREIVTYRDVDVLHSSPDVAYRASVMRFM